MHPADIPGNDASRSSVLAHQHKIMVIQPLITFAIVFRQHFLPHQLKLFEALDGEAYGVTTHVADVYVWVNTATGASHIVRVVPVD